MARNVPARKPATPKTPPPAAQLAEMLGSAEPAQQIEVVRGLLGQLEVAAQPPSVLVITGNLLTGQVSVTSPDNAPIEGQLALLNQASLSLLRQSIEAQNKAKHEAEIEAQNKAKLPAESQQGNGQQENGQQSSEPPTDGGSQEGKL